MGRPSRVQVTGPLATYSDGFRLELARQGFTPHSASCQLQLMAHASRWLAGNGLGAGDLTPARVKEFLDARRAEGYTLWLSPKAMVPMLGYLRGIGVVATPVPAGPSTPAEKLMEAYRTYLVQERGLAVSTVAGYLHVARLFLSTRPAEEGLGLERLSASDVTTFVLAECTMRTVGSAKYIVCGLRSLLRYLYVGGHIEHELTAAVPRVAGWRLAGLPKAISAHDVARLLGSCDRRSTFGRRDFAVLSVFARLGLRSGEVAALELADIDWRAGEIVIRGKGRRRGAPAPSRRRGRGHRRLAAPGSAPMREHEGLHQGAGAAPGPERRRRVGDRDGGQRPSRAAGDARPPPSPHRGHRDAAGRGQPGRGRPGPAPRQRVDHGHLRQGRPQRTPLAGAPMAGSARHERAAPRPRRLPRHPPGAGVQARPGRTPAGRLHLPHRGERERHRHHRRRPRAGRPCRPTALPNGGRHRLSVVRGFARLPPRASTPPIEVPPPDMLPGRSHRATPYPYSDGRHRRSDDRGPGSCASPLRAATFETLVGPAGGDRAAHRRGPAARPRRRRPGRGRAGGPQLQVRQVAARSPLHSTTRRGAGRLRPPA